MGDTNHSVFWGSPAWLDDNDKIKKEFMFDREYLEEGKTKKRIIE